LDRGQLDSFGDEIMKMGLFPFLLFFFFQVV